MPLRARRRVRKSRVPIVIAAVLGLFFLHVISCCTIDQGHLPRHHHHIAVGAVSAGDNGCDHSSPHPECCEESDRLWMRAIDGQGPLHLEAILGVPTVEEPPAFSPPVRRIRFHIPHGVEPHALCVLRI